MIERLKTVKEVAEILGVKPARVYELKDRKKLKFVLLGERQFRFPDSAIQKFIDGGGNQEEKVQNDETTYIGQRNGELQNDSKR